MIIGRKGFKLITADEVSRQFAVTNKSIVLTGPPSDLVGRIGLCNQSDEPIHIRNLPVDSTGKNAITLPQKNELSISAKLLPGEEMEATVTFSLDERTPPGEYHASIKIDDKEHEIQLIVQPSLAVEISPRNLNFIGAKPGQIHKATLLLVNNGNVPVQIPSVHHSTLLDVDTICRNLSVAVRESGGNGSVATLDAFVKGIQRDMADWVELSMPEAKQTIDPGNSLQLHLTLKLPGDVSNKVDMHKGAFRFLNKIIHYCIYT